MTALIGQHKLVEEYNKIKLPGFGVEEMLHL